MKPKCVSTTNNNNGSMAEWSNATDSRSVLFGGAGSNPAGDILRILTAIILNKNLTFTQTFKSSSMTKNCLTI